MQTNWKVDDYYYDPIAYAYVIFEYDAFPAGDKIMGSRLPSCLGCTLTGGGYSNITCLSFNSPYGKLDVPGTENYAIYGNVSNLPAGFSHLKSQGYSINTIDIEFNTVEY